MKRKTVRKTAAGLLALFLCAFLLFSCSEETFVQLSDIINELNEALEEVDTAGNADAPPQTSGDPDVQGKISKEGAYYSKEDVALYIHTFGKLPPNFIKKSEAEKLGWQNGPLDKYAPGKCIGGDFFANVERKLPTKSGRIYRECDIDTLGARERGAKRIVYSNDGLIYYTGDHYESFTLLYGNPKK